MKNLILLIVFLFLSFYQSDAQKWGQYVPMGDSTKGAGDVSIFFDATNNVVFNTSGYSCFVDIETNTLTKVLSSVEYNDQIIDLNGYDSRSMAFSPKSSLQSKSDSLVYISEDTTIIYSTNEIPELEASVAFISYHKEKYYIVYGFLSFFKGMHILDDNTLELTHIEPDELFDLYPIVGPNYKSYGIWNDKLYYLARKHKLIEYNVESGVSDSVDLWDYHFSHDFFGTPYAPRIFQNKLFVNSTKDFQYYMYDFETKELVHEDFENTIIRADYDGFFDNYDSLKKEFVIKFEVKCDYKGGLIAQIETARPVEYPQRYYFKPPNGDWKRLPFPDSVSISRYSEVDKNNVWWYYSVIKEEYREEGKSIFAAIPLDPYDETSIEETEAMPTIVPISTRPNPAVNYTEVRFYINPHTTNNVSFKLYDYLGNLIQNMDNSFTYDKTTAFASKRINVTGIKRGVYYLVIDNETEKQSIGFVVE